MRTKVLTTNLELFTPFYLIALSAIISYQPLDNCSSNTDLTPCPLLNIELKDQVPKAHNRQIWLLYILAKVGNTSPIGKLLRLVVYYLEAATMLKAWRDFL